MTKNDKLAIMKDRLSKLENNPKDWKCPGVIRKLRRQVRALGGSVETTEE